MLLLTPLLCLQKAIADKGGDFSPALQSVTTSDSTPACTQHFGHWCLDGKHISRGGIIAVIVIGCLVLVALLAAIPALVLLRARKTRSYDQVGPQAL